MITVFTSPVCPKCSVLKRELTSLGIPFAESRDYDQMNGLTYLPAIRREDGTFNTYDEIMTELATMRKGNQT